MLTDTISEVEKLQAVQQFTVTLLPSSTVIVMTNQGDQCFKCQELGHIACNCPNMHCFECKEYGHIAVDFLDKIQPFRHSCAPQEMAHKVSHQIDLQMSPQGQAQL